jgi:hypothetical protein
MFNDEYHPQECLHEGFLLPVGDRGWLVDRGHVWMMRADQLTTFGWVLDVPRPFVAARLRAVLDSETLMAWPDSGLKKSVESAGQIVHAPIPLKVWARSRFLAEAGRHDLLYTFFTHEDEVAAFNREYVDRLQALGGEWHMEGPLAPAYIVVKGETVAVLQPCRTDITELPELTLPVLEGVS